ncbi:MAG: hypothetical protein RAK17_03995 [Caldisphaera sp.]|nr:hypothetical protein [Caldisphaera sp.]
MSFSNCNNKIIKIIESLIKKGLGKDCIESSLYFDYKISISKEEFLNYYDVAFNCLHGIDSNVNNKLNELTALCENEVVKDIILLILKEFEEKAIKAKIYDKYLLHKNKNGEYDRITMRDISNYYEIAKKCLFYKKYRFEKT